MSRHRYRPCLILLALCTPLLISGENKDALLLFIRDFLPTIAQGLDLETIGHFIIFLLVPLVLFHYKVDFIYIPIVVVILALTTEILQLFIKGRYATLDDFIVDLTGGFIVISGVLLFKHHSLIDWRKGGLK